MKRILKIFILTVFLFNIVNISCFANSGPSYWQGSDATGVVMRENCPLTVEKEILTFLSTQIPKLLSHISHTFFSLLKPI